MATTIQEAFPLSDDGAILDAFFKDMSSSRKGGKGALARAGGAGSKSLTSKIWSEIEMLNNSDETAFFTIAFHHPALHVVIPECFEAAARSIVSSTKEDRVPKVAIQALSEIAIKIITGFDPASITRGGASNNNNNNNAVRGGRGESSIDMISYCQRLQKLFPPSSWMSLAHVLYRQCPAVATIVLNALVLHVPGDLPALKAIAMTWCDNVGILYDRCLGEAKRGRFMRTNGDILVLFESAFRLSSELWCLLEAAPIPIAPYLPLDHVLDSLAILTNKIAPLLQYFVLHSEDLVSSRKRLSRANALIVNAAIRSSVIVTLFTPFVRGSAEESAVSVSKGTGYAHPRPVLALDESVTSQLLESLPPASIPCRLLKRCGSLLKTLKSIVPLFASDGGNNTSTTTGAAAKRSDRSGRATAKRKITSDHNVTLFDAGNYRLGEILADLVREACGGTGGGGGGKGAANSAASVDGNSRFVELLLIELINQGCSISDWVSRELVDEYESSLLGGGSGSASAPAGKGKRGSDKAISPAPCSTGSAAAQRRKGDRRGGGEEGGEGEGHYDMGRGGGDDDDDAALAAAIAASRAEAGLPPGEEEGDIIHFNSNNTNASSMAAPLSPAVEMALSVLPHFTPKQIEAALAYYDNNIEAFIVDATSDNLPPHLSSFSANDDDNNTNTARNNGIISSSSATLSATMASPSPSSLTNNNHQQQQTTAATATSSRGVGASSAYDGEEEEDSIPAHLDMFSFLNEIDRVEQQEQQRQAAAASRNNNNNKAPIGRFTSSYVDFEGASAEVNDDGYGVSGLGEGMGQIMYSSNAYFGAGFGMGEMDSDLKHRTAMLAKAQHERLYEDERDDAVDEDDEANRFLAGKIKADESDDSDDEEEVKGGSYMYNHRGDEDDDYAVDNEQNTFVPLFNNRALGGPMRGGGGGGGGFSQQPKYTLKSTTFRVGGDSRNSAGKGKDPRDKKKERPHPTSSSSSNTKGGGGGQGEGRGGAGATQQRGAAGGGGGERRGENGRGPKGAKVNKSNLTKLMKAGAL